MSSLRQRLFQARRTSGRAWPLVFFYDAAMSLSTASSLCSASHFRLQLLACTCLVISARIASADVTPDSAALHLDFQRDAAGVRLQHGARHSAEFGALEFTAPLQFAEVDFSRRLHAIEACTIGGWFLLRRSGEQALMFRGAPEVGVNGERFFRPAADWVKLLLGTDQRGFLMGCVHGNSRMPFPLVTIDELEINAWHQLVAVKDAGGGQKFFHNGVLVHSDEHAETKGRIWPFIDRADGEPLRLAVPLGGLIGEAWVFAHELSRDEIAADFENERVRYHPALPVKRVALREMNAHHAAGLWRVAPTAETWAGERRRIEAAVRNLIGPMPAEAPALEAKSEGEEIDCGSYWRRKVSFQVQPSDRMPAWLLVPKGRERVGQSVRWPAIVCMYGTTSGAGKDTTVGLSGAKPGSTPSRNRAFAIDMVEAGFVALAPDWLRDGERLPPSGRAYDTTDFYERFPEWSLVGKDIWDTQRAVDYLQSLPFIDPKRIGMVGHSYGGHSTIFAAALDPRIRCVFASGPVSDFLHHGQHWAVPKGAGNSQSLPQLRPYVLDRTKPLPVTFHEWTALLAPRPLWVQQAAGERRPMEEENHAAVAQVYRALGAADCVRYMWQAGDHDFPPEARAAAVEWFQRWLGRSN